MSRRFWLLHHQNVLDHVAEVPRDRLRPEGQVPQGGSRGGRPSRPATAAHLPESEENQRLSKASRIGLGLHRAIAELLRRGRQNRQRGDAGATVQPNVTAHGRLRPHVLWPGLQHTPVHQGVAV